MSLLEPRQEKQLLWLLAALQFSHILDFMILMPLAPELMPAFGIDAGQFGLLVSAYTFASALMGVLGSFWLDRFDRKPTLLLLYAGFIGATVACALAPDYRWLMAARFVAGGCAGLMGAVVMTIVADVIPPQRRGQAIGTVMSAFGICAVAGVPVGLALAAMGGWRMPFWGVAALAAVFWVLLAWCLPAIKGHLNGEAPRSGLGEIWRMPGLPLGWLLTFTVVFASFLLIPYLGAYLVGNVGIAFDTLPWLYCAAGAATLYAMPRIGKLVDRFGKAQVLVGLVLASMVPHLIFSHLPPSPLWLVLPVFIAFMVLTSGRAIPAMALLTGMVPPHLRGRYLAVNIAASDGASGLGAWVAGHMIVVSPAGALQGFGTVGWLAAASSLAALCLLWLLVRVRRLVAVAA
ncbi:myxochelin export MFS transporter MxcK [Jeongeupia naejangsanensis]|uniref:Myxochelin export MFS transporter MxcK n=1 Tax=Jeongeupia naejangsanensis TaxID=613195 RepID=A0ABS2BGZ6_9NEIS|nr:myxochelin export MFS transporter MxcK [Jeongeupia naejangsanensis]MBM3114883.1 myxochelin export MFS transporter MxcK [Jeongeupia naejangsanensis]